MKKIIKKPTSVRLDDDLIVWLEQQTSSQSEVINEALRIISRIDMETIKRLSDRHMVYPSFLIDMAVNFFSKLDLAEQVDKMIDYLEVLRLEAEKEEREEAERERNNKEKNV